MREKKTEDIYGIAKKKERIWNDRTIGSRIEMSPEKEHYIES
jgi:hypothetical protein